MKLFIHYELIAGPHDGARVPFASFTDGRTDAPQCIYIPTNKEETWFAMYVLLESDNPSYHFFDYQDHLPQEEEDD